MAHFAELDNTNTVLRVLVVNNTDIIDPETGQESETIGIGFLQGLFGADTVWVQTSYNSNFRGVYAGIGYTYDPSTDLFVAPPLTEEP